MAIATKEIIETAENFVRFGAQRKSELLTQISIEDEEALFTVFHSSPKPADQSIKAFTDYLDTAPIADACNFESQGWYIGDVAWVIGTCTGHCPDGTDLAIRHVEVLRQINGKWKVAHCTLSEGVVCRQHLYPEEYK